MLVIYKPFLNNELGLVFLGNKNWQPLDKKGNSLMWFVLMKKMPLQVS